MGAFDGQVAFITGASSGIGAALARELARRGARVALAARRVDRLEALAAELSADGHRVVALACDVSKDGDLDRAVARTREELGLISVLVANAGFGVVGRLDALTLDDYRRQFDTNVFGVLRTIYAGLDDLKRSRGRLIIIGSVSGHVGFAGGSAYVMSKFAIRGLAQSLGFELARHGVSVTLASPGYVESEIHQVDNQGVRHPEARHQAPWLAMRTPRAARRILRAAARRRREVIVTTHARLTILIQRYAPGLLAWVLGRFDVRSRRPLKPAGSGRVQ